MSCTEQAVVQVILSALQQWPGEKAPVFSRHAVKHRGKSAVAAAVAWLVVGDFGYYTAERAIVARERCTAAQPVSFIKLWFCLSRGSQYQMIFSFVTSACSAYVICFPESWISANAKNTCSAPGSEVATVRQQGTGSSMSVLPNYWAHKCKAVIQNCHVNA